MKLNKLTGNILFFTGLVMLSIGALGITIFGYFFIIGLSIFTIGLVLIIVSNRNWKIKLSILSLYSIAIAMFWPIWSWMNTLPPEVFLIPDDYRGKVTIIYKKKCGGSLNISGDSIIYLIPADGILLLSEEHRYGIINHNYYLVNKNGKRTSLPKMDVRDFNEEWTYEKNPKEPSRKKLGVFHWGRTGSTGKMLDENENVLNNDELYTFQEFFVSTYDDLEKTYDFVYERKFDSITTNKVRNCK